MAGPASLRVELAREDFAAAAAASTTPLRRALATAPAGGPLQLRVSHRWLAADLTSASPRVRTALTPAAARRRSRLAYERVCAVIRAVVLVQRLPVPLRAAWRTVPSPPLTCRRDRRRIGASWPAWRSPRAAQIGSAVPAGRGPERAGGPRHRASTAAQPRAADGAWLDDQSTYGTYLNGERVGGRVQLRAGDRLRLGSPGVEFELVQVVAGDGAA
jgi:hypothetical protein